MIRVPHCCAPAVLLLVCLPGEARPDDARDLVERAIRARAGTLLKLNRTASMTQSMSGHLNGPGGRIEASRQVMANWPEQFLFRMEMNVGGENRAMSMGLTAGGGWKAIGGEGTDLNAAELEEFHSDVHAHYVATLLPLRKQGYELATIPGRKVAGADAAGVRVTHRGRPDVDLYFDRKSGQLVKAAFRANEGGVPVNKEWFYGDYKEFDGMTLPSSMTVTYDGREVASWKIDEYRFLRKIDDSVFDKP